MKKNLHAIMRKKLDQSFSQRWDPELELVWGYEEDTSLPDAVLGGVLYVDAIGEGQDNKRIHDLYGSARTFEELDDWLASFLSVVLYKHPVWRLSKKRKE